MAYRYETASGLRLYACAMRLRMGESGSLRFLDPYQLPDFAVMEVIFETKTIAKHCRLHDQFLHTCFERFNIVQGSLFLHEINDNISNPTVYIVRKGKEGEILSNPQQLI
jgi:hypothetical protein